MEKNRVDMKGSLPGTEMSGNTFGLVCQNGEKIKKH